MKKYKNILIILFGLNSFIFTGCEKQVLDKSPLDSFSEQDVWTDIELVKNYVWNNYNALGSWGNNSDWSLDLPASVSDDAFLIFNYGTWPTTTGVLSPSDMGTWGDKWNTNYNYIRNINIFFDRIDEVESENESEKIRLKGEMKFLRAWCYADLVNLFGGVPIITEVFGLDDDFQVPRESYQACVDWIISELNETKDMVPETVPSNEFGRVTKGAVLALKSRVLLYAASKLHDPSTEPSGPLFDYTKNDKWKEAADAAKEVIDMDYSLVEVNSWKDYQNMFLQNTSEVIFAKPFSSQFLQNIDPYDYVNSPNGYAGWSANCPTQGLVDDFEMKDGLSIEESPLYNPSPDSIYENRELRFYADIVFNGCQYRGRKVEFFVPGGLDSPDGREGWNYAKTGYTVRKSMDESLNVSVDKSTAPLIFFRLAEIYLNYSEAQYHLGNENIAREYVNKIRSRVHLPNISSSGEELLKDIRHEKRIEFALEGSHRFHDTRRWMTALETLSKNAKGIAWRKEDGSGNVDPQGQLVYEIITNQERDFKERMYYIPIPRSEIEKTDLHQNPGY